MATHVWRKPVLQMVLSELRKRGFTVEKLSAGYVIKEGEREVFKAMNGTRAYLVRYDEKWWNDYNAMRASIGRPAVQLPA